MRQPSRQKPLPIGLLIGLLVVVVPLAGYLLYLQLRPGDRERGRESASVADRAEQGSTRIPSGPSTPKPGKGRFTETLPIDETGLRDAGASIRDPSPPPDAQAINAALQRAERWLRRHSIDPFGGTGIDSLRLFALEVQCWDRLSIAQADPAARKALSGEVSRRLRRFLDPVRLNERLRADPQLGGVLEVLMLASRCRAYGVDPAPVLPFLETVTPTLTAALDRMPDATAALYVAHLHLLGIEVGHSVDDYRRTGVLANRPREVMMSIGDVRALTQEILAYTDLALRPLDALTKEEQRYLHRVLPHFALMYTLLQNHELAADLLSCLNLAGMSETYGYREGLRLLVTRQNADGSFGSANGDADRVAILATTAGCLTALSLEAIRIQGGR